MALTEAALNIMADALGDVATLASLHTADPSTTGTNETTAGRQTITWTTADNGDVSISAAENFTGGAGSGPCTHVGLWNSGGTVFYGGFVLTGDQAFNAAGEFTLTSVTINGSAA